MRPPLPTSARDTSDLDTEDGQILAGAGALSVPVRVHETVLNLSLGVRRSERAGGHVRLERALDVVAPLLSVTSHWVAADGYTEKQTAVPSAGGRHPLTALILSRTGDSIHDVWALSPSAALRRYRVSGYRSEIQRVLRATADALGATSEPHVVIVLLARFRRTLSKYPDGETLVWRDSGAFLGTAHLVATSLGLRSCIAGIAETTQFTLDGSPDLLVDVGALVLSEKE